jgi:uncharacterized integral membrane protein
MMKQLKIVFWILIIAFIALFVYQNQSLFLAKQAIRIDLQFASYELPDLPNVIILMACFLIGLLISYFFSLSERYRSKKIIKNLNTTIVSLQQEISTLKSSLEFPNDPGLEKKEDQAA